MSALRPIAPVLIALALAASHARAAPRKAIIDTPSFCHRVQTVEGNGVYLVSSGGACMPGPGKALVELDTDDEEVEIFVDGKLWKTQPLAGYDSSRADELARRALERSQAIELPPNPSADRAQRAAEELSRRFFAPEHQLSLRAEEERVRNALLPRGVGDGLLEEAGKKAANEKKASKGILSESERLYVFISHSVPLETLRTYAAAIHKAGDPNVVMVLRGMVGGMKYIRPTAEFVQSVLLIDPDCPASGKVQCEAHGASVLIDPLLFRRYEVTQVPTFVYARDVKLPAGVTGSEGLAAKASVGASFSMAGDMSLEYAVEALNRNAKSRSLETILQTLLKAAGNVWN